MKRRLGCAAFGSLALLLGLTSSASAAPTLRLQVEQRGDFVLLGNTLGFECNMPIVPIVGAVGLCGSNTADSAPDLYWRADSPSPGQVEANLAITNANARTTAMLNLPPGATITHAFLYWGAGASSPTPDTAVTLDRIGGFSANVTAMSSYFDSNRYQSMADITAIVQANGPGAYRVGDISGPALANFNDSNVFAGWWMVVFYQLATDPPRNLTLFDGFDGVIDGMPVTATLSNFLVPNGAFDAKLGVVAYEGDDVINTDQLVFNGSVLSNAQNPATNFFNGTRSTLGLPVHFSGDLPEMPGTPRSLAGIDLDVVDIAPYLVAGQTSAPIQVNTSSDVIYLGGFVTSISTVKPDLSTATKTAVDLNGDVVLPGDIIEYTISATNSGNDTATNVVLTDMIPAGLTYVPGSLRITQGANLGMKSDMPGDDQGEYDFATKTIRVRLGMNADQAMGGTLAVGETTTVAFRVSVDASALGPIGNQAFIDAAGQSGALSTTTPTDGNGAAPGAPPTVIMVAECITDAQCMAPVPHCNATNECVECAVDAHCPGLFPICDPFTDSCICIPSGPETCDNKDNDCNGQIDDGNPGGGMTCNTGQPGVCAAGTVVCQGGQLLCMSSTMPSAETCDNIDNDCDGSIDDGNPGGGMTCTTGLPGACAAGTTACQGGQLLCNQTTMSSAEICDNIDNDCDGSIDDGNPGGGMTCTTGLPGACAAGTTVCQGGQLLCNQTTMSSAEICDNIDNDCDGSIDDGNPGGGMACNTGQPGVCATGTTVCQGGNFLCNQTTMASAETCDGIDNDCNGVIDDGNPAGGTACNTGLLGVCAAGTTVCMGGNVLCTPTTTSSVETCDGLDNDCNGIVDNGFDLGMACSAGVGECIATGMIACDGMGGAACNAVPGNPVAETCDGLDNDCNGTIDDGNPAGDMACNTGLLGVCAAGTTVCMAGNVLCTPTTTSSVETCDGLDNDCNGTVDNGFDVGMACTAGVGECLATGMIACDGMGGAICDAQAKMPGTEVCGDGLDNDCDGSSDEDCSMDKCTQDSDCGDAKSGQICDLAMMPAACVPGCRGEMGNGCPDGKQCTSMDDAPGNCIDVTNPPTTDPPVDGGCVCAIQPANDRFSPSFGLLWAGAVMALLRRWRRNPNVRR